MQLSASDDKDTHFPCHARPKNPCQQYHNQENNSAKQTYQDYSSREPLYRHHYRKESSISEDIISFIQLLKSGDDKVRLEAAFALSNIVSTNHASTGEDILYHMIVRFMTFHNHIGILNFSLICLYPYIGFNDVIVVSSISKLLIMVLSPT